MSEDLFFAPRIELIRQQRCLLDLTNFRLPEGRIIVIIGPNGAGKTTLLRALMGFYNDIPIYYRGAAVTQALNQGKLAWVGQHERFELPLTLLDYVLLGASGTGLHHRQQKAADHELAAALLAEFELSDFAKRRIYQLSGGEKQRAAIVRALMQKTQTLFLDEPVNHLDIRHQFILMKGLRRRQQQGLSVVMVLHDLNLAARFADDVLLLEAGRQVAYGPVLEVMTPECLSAVYRCAIGRYVHKDMLLFAVDNDMH